MLTRLRIPAILSTFVINSLALGAQSIENEDTWVFELEAFEVIANDMKIIDGFTGKEYAGNDFVVREFRRAFNKLLTGYHKKLLVDEAGKLKTRADAIKPFEKDLSELAGRFGIKDFVLQGPHLTRELSIFKRMVKDPFFNIDELVVWDYSRLGTSSNALPKNKYSKNLRYNHETGKWERRVMTKWEVSWITSDRNPRQIYKFKEQGLNLDTQKGYHIVHGGLRPDVPPEAFQVVKLQYPIFYNTGESDEVQIRKLSENFLLNLIYIYDPYSWVVRGNTRFRGGFSRQLQEHLEMRSLPVKDRDWFVRILAKFLNDVVTIKYWGSDEIYDLQMLSSDQRNKNQLGIGLDLLNWQENENRKLDYDPTVPNRVPSISFENPLRARYILLDAYRRYGDTFLDTLIRRFNAIEGRTDSKQLIKDALEEVSGVSAEKYIPAAIKAQKTELIRFLRE